KSSLDASGPGPKPKEFSGVRPPHPNRSPVCCPLLRTGIASGAWRESAFDNIGLCLGWKLRLVPSYASARMADEPGALLPSTRRQPSAGLKHELLQELVEAEDHDRNAHEERGKEESDDDKHQPCQSGMFFVMGRCVSRMY